MRGTQQVQFVLASVVTFLETFTQLLAAHMTNLFIMGLFSVHLVLTLQGTRFTWKWGLKHD